MSQEQEKRRLIDGKNEPKAEGTDLQAPNINDAMGQIDRAMGKVQVTHGVNSNSFDVAGQTVAYVRENLETLYGIPAGAVALVNGEQVTEDFVLKASDAIDFVRDSGTKGM